MIENTDTSTSPRPTQRGDEAKSALTEYQLAQMRDLLMSSDDANVVARIGIALLDEVLRLRACNTHGKLVAFLHGIVIDGCECETDEPIGACLPCRASAVLYEATGDKGYAPHCAATAENKQMSTNNEPPLGSGRCHQRNCGDKATHGAPGLPARVCGGCARVWYPHYVQTAEKK
jgi:hypothetical protein